MQGDRPDAPADQQRERAEQRRATDSIDQIDPAAAPDPAADHPPDPLERNRREGAHEQPGGDRDQRRVRGLGAVGEQGRTDSRAERGAGGEADQRQSAGDQAALVPDRRERDRKADDADVDQVQDPASETTNFSRVNDTGRSGDGAGPETLAHAT